MDKINWATLIPVLVALIASAPGAVALVLQWKRYMKEPAAVDGDASSKYMQAAKGEAEYSLTLQKRVTDLEAAKKELEAENKLLRETQEAQEKRIKELETLVASLQAELVKYRKDC